jgi:serine protease
MTSYIKFNSTLFFVALAISPFAAANANTLNTKFFNPKTVREQALPAAMTDRMIVKLRSAQPAFMAREISADRLNILSATAGLELKVMRQMAGGAHVLKLPGYTSLADAEQYAEALRSHPDVEFAAPDRLYQAEAVPNDPLFTGALYTLTQTNGSSYQFLAQQWYLNDPVGGINAPKAWDITTGSPNLNIAVVDTGSTSHPDMNGRFFGGYDFIDADSDGSFTTANDRSGRDSDPADPGDWVTSADLVNPIYIIPNSPTKQAFCIGSQSSWHGTAVAGIIGATANNNNYGAGINWNSRIIPIRVLGKCISSNSDILDAATYAAGISVPGVPPNLYPARVINLSLGGAGVCDPKFEQPIYDAITAKGVVLVGSAGNGGADNIGDDASGHAPAGSCKGIIAVAATGQRGQLASYSNFGASITVSAPGGAREDQTPKGNILHLTNTGTTAPLTDDFDWDVGTSFAAPVVTGVVSLMLSANPNLTPAQVTDILRRTARQFPAVPAGFKQCSQTICGAGIVDAAAAVAEAQRQPGGLQPNNNSGGGGGGCHASSANGPADISLAALLGISLLWRIRSRRKKSDFLSSALSKRTLNKL